MISARILLDSRNHCENRLTTWELTYPRWIHSEFMAHRVFSRNAASSRAIPTLTMIERVIRDPALPVQWGRNQRGMQAANELSSAEQRAALRIWLDARDDAVARARELAALGVHKQLANRLLEPWLHITVICSATEFDNWFALRTHPAAQPEIRALATQMLAAYTTSAPILRAAGEWHVPLLAPEEESLPLQTQLQIATARCARVSYLTHDGTRDTREDVRLHDRLVEHRHWSPFEHCAQALAEPQWIGNFCGWKQYRKSLPGEDGRRPCRDATAGVPVDAMLTPQEVQRIS